MNGKQAWFVGECMVELRRARDGLLAQTFSGDVYNTAVYFSRVSTRLLAYFVSAVGEDPLSEALLKEAARQGLHTDYVMRNASRQPGLYLIETGARGERSFIYWRGQSAARVMLDTEHTARLYAAVDNCRLLYFSGITLAILDDERRERLLDLARAVRECGGWVAFDSNYRPRLWADRDEAVRWVDAALAAATHVLVTFDDEVQLHGEASPAETLQRVLESGAQDAVVKLGAGGCVARAAANEMLAVPAEVVTVLDTTAAGDSFNAGYLAARWCGASPEAAARAGTHLAGRVVAFPGAIIDQAAMGDLLPAQSARDD
jgi:2-dehydro-3-deoxygluconokinase